MGNSNLTSNSEKNERVWIVDDDKSIRWVLEKALKQAFSQDEIEIHCFESGDEVLAKAATSCPDVLISDIRMPGIDGLALLEKIKKSYPELPVIIMTAHSDLDSAVASFEGGAFEYLPKPFDVDEAVAVTRRALLLSLENKEKNKISGSGNSNGDVGKITGNQEIIGEAPAMQEVFRAIGRLSKSNITVLINGESGTGKELVAQALHRHSPRKSYPFIALNMAAIPKDLMESELFGHEKGAFTGATQQHKGRFEQANGGTLFLDEIGDMPAETQTRLLRVLSDGEFFRVGGHAAVKVDVRIVAATHQNLEQLVGDNQFREDLFHRLNVIRLHLPRLADRREDIPALMQHFLARAAQELSVESKTLLPETERYLLAQDWPGNVRQLENVCRWLTVMASGREIHLNELPPELMSEGQTVTSSGENWQAALQQWVDKELAAGHEKLLDNAIPIFETIMIEGALKFTAGRKREAAEILGWGRNTLTRKIKELQLELGDDSSAEEDVGDN